MRRWLLSSAFGYAAGVSLVLAAVERGDLRSAHVVLAALATRTALRNGVATGHRTKAEKLAMAGLEGTEQAHPTPQGHLIAGVG